MKRNIKPLFIKPTTTIRETMRVITQAAREKLPVGIALVIGPKNRLLGTVTDGDIRKALVREVNIDSSVEHIMASNPITVDEALSTDEMIKSITQKVKASGRIHDTKVDKVIIVNAQHQVVDVRDFYELWYKQETWRKDICVVGTGHVGLTLGVALADLGFKVVGYDINKKHVQDLNKAKIKFYEKGLEPLLRLHLKKGNIRFVSAVDQMPVNVFIVSVGTPVNDRTRKPDNTAIKKAAYDVGRVLKKDDLVILRSTVTVGTTRQVVLPILEKASSLKAGKDFYLVFAPERVVEGNALEEIRTIPQIVGGINNKSVQEAAAVLQTITPSVVILESLEAAEMVKLVNNTYRDYSFAFANKMAQLCEQLKLDTVKIIQAASEGYPRNPVPLPSPGVGGYCLTKDPYLLADVAERHRLTSDMFIHSRHVNQSMPKFVANKITRFLNRSWKGKSNFKVFIMGLAFKGYPETSDMRGSPAVDVIEILKERMGPRGEIIGYDPVVKKEDLRRLGLKQTTVKQGFKDAHAVLIMNNNREFSKLDIFSLLETTKKPTVFFDGWQFFSRQEIEKVDGITYEGLGGAR